MIIATFLFLLFVYQLFSVKKQYTKLFFLCSQKLRFVPRNTVANFQNENCVLF
jgi:hypothetical protein